MTTSYHRNNTRTPRTPRTRVWSVVCAVALTIFAGSDYVTHGRVSGFVRDVSAPGMYAASYLVTGVSSTLALTRANELKLENARLQEQITLYEQAMPADRLAAYSLETTDRLAETLTLLAADSFSHTTPIPARVSSYAQYPFGTLVAQLKSPLTSTEHGQLRYVVSDSGVVIGVLDSFTDRSIVVRLFSRSGEEHQMRVGETELALVRGTGGVTLEAFVPKVASIHIDDPVYLPDLPTLLVGRVGEVFQSETDTTQRVLIRLGASPYTIKSVLILE